jgi:hypothetical protein
MMVLHAAAALAVATSPTNRNREVLAFGRGEEISTEAFSKRI